MEHPGRLHRDLGRRRRPGDQRTARPHLRLARPVRHEPGPGPLRPGPPRPGVHLRARRGRLPQALLGLLPGGARLPAAADPHRPRRDHGRDLQRAQHQPHRRRGDRAQRPVRRRLPARDHRGVPGDRLAAGRLRARSAVPGADGGRRGQFQFLGARAVPPVGADAVGVRRGAEGPGPDAVPGRVRLDRPVGARPADRVHGQPLRRRLGHRQRAHPAGGERRRVQAVPAAQAGRPHPQRAAAGGRGLRAAVPLGHGHPPPLERPVRVAAVHQRDPPGLLLRSARGTRGGGPQGLPPDPGHEPGLHGQGRLLHRHQAGPAPRRVAPRRRRGLGDARLARHRAPLSGRGPGQGLAAARLRRPPRRHHRLGVGPGVHRPDDRLAGAARPGRERARRRHPGPGRPGRPRRRPRPGRVQLRDLGAAGRADGRRPGARPPRTPRGPRGRPPPCRRPGGSRHGPQGRPARRGVRPGMGARRGPHHPQRVLRGDGRPGTRRWRQQSARTDRGRPGAAARRGHRERDRRPGGVPEAPALR